MSVLTNGSFTSPNLITSNLNIVSVNDVITNGNFSQPGISDGVFLYWNDLTQSQQDLFFWTPESTSTYVSLQRGITAFNYPKPIGISTQYCSIQWDSSMQQLVSLTKRGYYQLSYYYVARPGYTINPLNFVLNSTIALDSIPATSVSSWTNRKKIYYNYDTSANLNVPLLIQAQGFGEDKNTAITNVVLTEVYGSASNTEFNTVSYYWDISGTVYLVSNMNPSYDFPDLYELGTRQFSIISNQSSISQSITLTGYGYYTIQFYYASRTGYNFNNLEIYYADILIDTITSCTTGVWNLYQKDVLISYSKGIPNFELRGITSNAQIGLAEIQFIGPPSLIDAPPVPGYIQSVVVGASPDLSMNLMNKTSIYGRFSVQNKYASYNSDGTPSGRLLEEGDARFYGNLTVYGYSRFMNTIDAVGNWSKTGSNIFYSSGKVGVGSSSVLTAPLNVISSNNSAIDYNGIYCYNNNNSQNCIIATRTSNGGNPLFSMDLSGTTNGGWCMGVDRTDLSKFKIANSNNDLKTNTRLIINSSGQVGILRATPAYPLDVNGDVNVTGNFLISRNITTVADGTQSIFFKNGTAFIGRIFGNSSAMFYDFYNNMTFRYCNNTTNTITNSTLLQLHSNGITVNGSITANSFSFSNPNSFVYKTTITSSVSITQNTQYSVVVNSVPAGLYIITYNIVPINVGSTTLTINTISLDVLYSSSASAHSFNDYTTHSISGSSTAGKKNQFYGQTFVFNNTATNNFTLRFYFPSISAGFVYGSVNFPTYLQLTKIG